MNPACRPAESPAPGELDSSTIESVFNRTFFDRSNTRLQGGSDEPLYLPATPARGHHLIIYRHDYAASALHEVAHWCVAGRARRQQQDYGYWYAEDGRNPQQQLEFERVEIRPQALEWVFSVAAARAFSVSADNLAAGLGASESFRDAIHSQVMTWCHSGLPQRARRFGDALALRSGVANLLHSDRYLRANL